MGDVAAVAWSRVSNDTTRWTIASTVPVRLMDLVIQPPPIGHLIVLDVPNPYKVRVGAASVWMTYDRDNGKYKVTIDGPQHMKAHRSSVEMRPDMYVPKGGEGPRLTGQKAWKPVGGGV
jgi:hypothetical protein